MVMAISGFRISEVIHESEASLVCRGYQQANNQPVVLKMLNQIYPSPEKIAWFRREYELLKSLNLAGVVRAYSLQTNQLRLAMVLEDFGGKDLTGLTKNGPVALDEFLPLAAQIAEALSQIHQQNIIHKDINPSNIVWNPVTGQVKLVDFGISTILSRENPTMRSPNVMEGTLAYISPEQTGRMNRTIDYRTDFYSLGVTYYELLTGQLPFPTTDAMELVHAHIARHPIPPHRHRADIPQPLSDIILTLMSKNAEDRYQSAYGLKMDLEECWRQWHTTKRVEAFSLGQHDISSRLQIPQKLYGRARETDQLLTAFERVSQGASDLMLVVGYAGIGKSVLVQEVYKPITRQRGYFIAGKFDQFQRNIPYASLVQAFRTLMRQLLTESAAQVAKWREKLLAAVGPNGQIIIEVIPEVALIIGPQPDVPDLAPAETQNRFNLVFQNFIRVFTQPEHPLVLFLDDLQWADAASLGIVKLLMTAPNSQHLFIIGAYRDNEVTLAHPLISTLDEIRQAGVPVNRIELEPLDLAIVKQFMADTFNCSLERIAPLAELVLAKTQGNPFFISEFLKSLYAEGLLSFVYSDEEKDRGWQWDLSRIHAQGITDNVVQLMAGKIQKLDQKTQQVLMLAACIGNQFDLKTVAIVYERDLPETAADLWQAIVENLILPLDETYKLVDLDVKGLTEEVNVEYKFAHDRIQQAVYSLIPTDEKQAVHQRVGQLLYQNTPVEARDQRIFDIVNQLNLAQSLIERQTERDDLAELNLLAGRKAKAAVAYQPASDYFHIGLSLLRAGAWERQYDLTLSLYIEAAEIAYLNGNFEQMEQLLEVILEQARRPLDKVKAYEISFQAYFVQNEIVEIINTGRRVLALLGMTFPEKPTESDVAQALEDTRQALAAFQARTGKQIADLIDLPEMSDPDKLASIGIIANVAAAAYGAFPETYLLYVAANARIPIEYGNSASSARSYVAYGIVLCGMVGDIERGYQFGKLALSLVERFKAEAIKPIVIYLFNGLIAHWREHLRETLSPLLAGYQSGLETGTLQFAALCAYQYAENAYWAGRNLIELEQEMARYNQAMAQLNQTFVLNWNLQVHQVVLNLIGPGDRPYRLIGESYDEEKMYPIHLETDDQSGLAYLYISKLLLCYLFREYEQALENAALTEKYLTGLMGRVTLPIFHFYDSLARLALFEDMNEAEQKVTLSRIAANQEMLQSWTRHAPMNYQHKIYLVEAEQARVLGNHFEAREYYDQAVVLAHEHQYINEEALAHELAARFYLARDQPHIGRHYLADAHYAYLRWGAKAKAKDLENHYPQYYLGSSISASIDQISNSVSEALPTTITTSGRSQSGTLDLISVLKGSQTISGEIVLDKLLARLMIIVIENAGAQKGYFVLHKEGRWVIEARGIVDEGEIAILPSTPLDTAGSALLPATMINYVVRTRESVVLRDASQDEQYATDPYVLSQQPKSVLCTPLLNQGKLTGILYLENNLTIGAFTPDRLEVLNLLSAQIAISIENARLYTNLEQSEKKYRTLFEDSRDAIYIVTREGLFLDVNQAALNIFGYTREEMLALKAREMYANPDDRIKFQQAIEQTGSVRDFELKFRKKDGTIIDCLSTSTVRQGEDGTILGYQGVIRDITERKQAERERAKLQAIQGELDVAHNIQSSLLPPESPQWPELDVVCYSTPAREVGGDFYTYHVFGSGEYATSTGGEQLPGSEPEQERDFAIAVGDVSGKGMPAALLMSISLASLEASIDQSLSPGDLLIYLDRVLNRYTRNTFQNCALCLTEISLSTRLADETIRLSVANAGCVTPIVRRAHGPVTWVDAVGIPLGTGLGAELGYQVVNLELSRGDLIILTSDGVIEANNRHDQIFGFERLEQAVSAGPISSAQAMLDHLRAELAAFVAGAEQNDDVTIVAIRA